MARKTASATGIDQALPKGLFESIEDLYAVLEPVMKAIAAAVGEHCEVVLHDLSRRDMNHTIYAIENGHVSGRAVGGPSTNLGLEVLQDEEADHDEFGYTGHTADGRELRCSSIYYRNAAGRIIGSLCINLDLTPLQSIQNILGTLLPAAAQRDSGREIVAPNINTVLDDIITEAINATGRPVAVMDKADRIEALRILDERGAFRIKRAVERVAKRLAISKVTAYSYLEQVRNQTGEL